MKQVTRLVSQFKPEHYDLTWTINKDNLTFSGTVVIRGKKLGRPTRRITLHQKGLRLQSATLRRHDKNASTEIHIDRINSHAGYDEVRLHTSENVLPGTYEITIAFSGTITRAMNGIYPCSFTYKGAQQTIIATQFESHHAREAFPCIDEPEAKATFAVTLITDTKDTVLCNTQLLSESIQGAHKTSVFETSPIMSSYLLAFVVGDIHSRTARTKSGTTVSVWASRAQKAASLEFPLDVAVKSIEFFEDYFGVAYPLAKADHVALPDFSSGAMENWGLITYREQALLIDPKTSSQSTKELVTTVITHETSHQWFGNLVTMAWWDDLWLNESFANMMEYRATDALFPQWHAWNEFISTDGLAALRRDSTPGVQSVRTDVHHPDEISTLFDPSIVYAKGGRLLYMLMNYIGEDTFKQGLTAYFKAHAYSNTRGNDLWQALSTASQQNIADFMTPWLERSGYPVISVTQDGTTVHLKQQHFLSDMQKTDSSRVWPVPLFAGRTDVPKILQAKKQTITLKNSTYIQLNQAAAGHYIVHYTKKEHRDAILLQVSNGSLGIADRLLFLYSHALMARAGIVPYVDVLEILEAYVHEEDDSVWEVIATVLAEAKRFVDYDESLDAAIKKLTARLIAKLYKKLGWYEKPQESNADTKLRATIISLGAYAEVPHIITTAKELYAAGETDANAIPAELRSIVYSVAVKQKVPGAFADLISRYESSVSAELKGDIAAALNSTKDTREAQVLLDRLTDPQKVKPQDADRSIFQMLINRFTRQTAWDWMLAHWDWIKETYESDKSFDNFPRLAASVCNTPQWQKRYHEHFDPLQNVVMLARNIKIGAEEIEDRIAWLRRDLPTMQRYFAKK